MLAHLCKALLNIFIVLVLYECISFFFFLLFTLTSLIFCHLGQLVFRGFGLMKRFHNNCFVILHRHNRFWVHVWVVPRRQPWFWTRHEIVSWNGDDYGRNNGVSFVQVSSNWKPQISPSTNTWQCCHSNGETSFASPSFKRFLKNVPNKNTWILFWNAELLKPETLLVLVSLRNSDDQYDSKLRVRKGTRFWWTIELVLGLLFSLSAFSRCERFAISHSHVIKSKQADSLI